MRFPIQIDLRRSRLLFGLTSVLHTLAAGCLLSLPWPSTARYLLLAVVAWSAWQTQRPSRVVGLRLAANGDLACLMATGEQIPASVQPDTAVFSQLVVLRLRARDSGQLENLALFPDSMPVEQFRLLRLWLRWRAEASDRFEGGV